MTLDAAIRDYLRHLAVERGRSAHTIAAYRRDLARYAAYVAAGGAAGEPPIPTDHAVVVGFVRHLVDELGLAASSASRTTVAVRQFHAYAHDEGYAADNPAARVAPGRLADRLPKALSVDETLALLGTVVGDSPRELRDRALLELLYGTGARISEAVGLAVDDVDAAGRSVRLFGKGAKVRVVPFGEYAAAALDAYLVRGRPALAAAARGGASSGGRLFLNARGTGLSRQSAWAIVAAAAERAGLAARVSPHTLRHSFATHLIEGGADVRVVQELLGHANVVTTQIYTRVTVTALREAYALAHPRARGG